MNCKYQMLDTYYPDDQINMLPKYRYTVHHQNYSLFITPFYQKGAHDFYTTHVGNAISRLEYPDECMILHIIYECVLV